MRILKHSKRAKPKPPMPPRDIAAPANRPSVTSRRKIIKFYISGDRLDAALRMKTLMDARALSDVPKIGMRLLDHVLSRMQLGWRFQMCNDKTGETVDISLLPLLYGKADKPLVYSRTTHDNKRAG